MRPRAVFCYRRKATAIRRLTRRAVLAVFACVVSISATRIANAQAFAGQAAPTTALSGFHLYSTTTSFGYTSLSAPLNSQSSSSLPGYANSLEDFTGWASLSTGYVHENARTRFSIVYNPSFYTRIRYSDSRALNQSVAISSTVTLTPRWTFRIAASGDDSTAESFLFSFSSLSQNVSAPDMNGAAGPSLSTTGGSVFDGTADPVPSTTSIAGLTNYGTRVLMYGLQGGLTYKASPRVEVAFGFGMHQFHNRDHEGKFQSTYLAPRATSGEALVTVSYAVTPKMQAGISVTSSRVISYFGDYYATTVAMNANRSFGRHWFAAGQVGSGILTPVWQATPAAQRGLSYTAGVSLGYKTRGNTLAIRYDRMIGDPYGTGGSVTTNVGGAWSWRRPGAHWAFSAEAGRQNTSAWDGRDLTNWNSAVRLSRALRRDLSMNLSYSYLSNKGAALQHLSNITMYGAQVSVVWVPALRERPRIPVTAVSP